MKDTDRQTRSHLMDLFSERGMRPQTRLGQNFLIDLNLVEFIASEGRLDEHDVVLEIGTGTGGMTTFLAEQAGSVVSVELDPRMYALAKESTAACPNVHLLNCDALKNKNHFNPEVLALVEEQLALIPESRLKVVANLPYSIATPVISNMVASDLPWVRMIVTIQLELAQRMAATPAKSTYGALSVWLQAQCRVKILKRLGMQVFWPRPRVNSAIMRLSPNRQHKDKIASRPFLQDFLRRLFHVRRKLLRGVIVSMYRRQLEKSQVDAILEAAGLTGELRAEELEVPVLVDLANRLFAEIENVPYVEFGAAAESETATTSEDALTVDDEEIVGSDADSEDEADFEDAADFDEDRVDDSEAGAGNLPEL